MADSKNLPVLGNLDNLRNLLNSKKDSFARALPKIFTPDKFIQLAINAAGKIPGLYQCTTLSFMKCLMDSATLGLEPNTPSRHAWIIPYKEKATFIIGYMGYIELAYRSGEISSIYAHSVYDKDHFVWEYGLNQKLEHRPYIGGDRGQWIAVYAVAHFKGESRPPLFIVLDKSQVEKRRKASPSGTGDYSPWRFWWDEMAEKTAIRTLARFLPSATEVHRATIMEGEEESLVDIDDVTKIAEGSLEDIARRKSEASGKVAESIKQDIEENDTEKPAPVKPAVQSKPKSSDIPPAKETQQQAPEKPKTESKEETEKRTRETKESYRGRLIPEVEALLEEENVTDEDYSDFWNENFPGRNMGILEQLNKGELDQLIDFLKNAKPEVDERIEDGKEQEEEKPFKRPDTKNIFEKDLMSEIRDVEENLDEETVSIAKMKVFGYVVSDADISKSTEPIKKAYRDVLKEYLI